MEQQNNGVEDIQKSLQAIEGMYPSLERTYEITAEELITLRAKLFDILVNNTSNVFDQDGKMVGQTVAPQAAPVQDLYRFLMNNMMLRFYQEGSLVDYSEYEKQLQTIHAKAQEQDAPTPTLLDEKGESISLEE